MIILTAFPFNGQFGLFLNLKRMNGGFYSNFNSVVSPTLLKLLTTSKQQLMNILLS